MSITAVKKLQTSGTDLSKGPLPTILKKAVLAIVNDYSGQTKWPVLGAGPNNDAFHILKIGAQFGYSNYFLRNGKSSRFLQVLDHFLKETSGHLIVFYVGHGTNVRDLNGDEDDGYDEAMVFDDGFVIDDVLRQHLVNFKNTDSILTLITDACHSGSIWDLQSQVKGVSLPPNVLSMSAASDKQTAKQTYVESLDQGMFTHFMKKAIKTKPSSNPLELRQVMKPQLQKYCQTVTIATTSRELLDKPLFGLI